MKNILEMEREEILDLKPTRVTRLLEPLEVVHIARLLDAFWSFPYGAARAGKAGRYHALLKSGLHSDGFFVSRIILDPWNVRYIIANQMVKRLRMENPSLAPDYVAGIPDGATKLGEEVAWMLGLKHAEMKKVDGRIYLVTRLEPGRSLLLVEDFCTRGTGFKEAVKAVLETWPDTKLALYNPVILNRGGLTEVTVDGVGDFKVLPVVEWRVKDWEAGPKTCPLCAMGSIPIKPKATEENWALINSELPIEA